MIGKRIRIGVGAVFVGLVLMTGSAAAAPGCSASSANCGDVLGENLTAPQASPSLALTPDEAPAGSLPFTGGDVAGLVLIGAAALGAGTVLVRRSRSTAAK